MYFVLRWFVRMNILYDFLWSLTRDKPRIFVHVLDAGARVAISSRSGSGANDVSMAHDLLCPCVSDGRVRGVGCAKSHFRPECRR